MEPSLGLIRSLYLHRSLVVLLFLPSNFAEIVSFMEGKFSGGQPFLLVLIISMLFLAHFCGRLNVSAEGHGKQVGWHMYPEESARGVPPLGSRFNERSFDDENSQPFLSRGDGRYFRNSRESRCSSSQKDWKVNSLEPPKSPRGLGKLDNEVNDQRSVGNVQTCNNNDNHNKNNSHPDPNFEKSPDQSQLKYHLDESGSDADGLGRTVQKVEIENSLGSIDWKPVKWTRSESLSSRGSGFSHSSSSKSMGADSNEMKAEMQPKNVMAVQSPSGEAVACVKSNVPTPAPSEETSSRKKPRLGWGEGLAKYEKKNVDGPEDGATQNGLVISENKREPAHSLSANVADRSPRVAVFLDDTSPATPSSVACSSSPGTEENQSVKVASVDHDASNLSCSRSILSHNPCQGPAFNLENLEPASVANLSSYINELLQSDDSSSMDAGFVQSTAMKKLMVWKVDILKAVEMTESEIDSLETELKSSVSKSRGGCYRPYVSCSLPVECNLRACEELVAGPAPLQFACIGTKIIESTANALETDLKEENIDSPGSATSKFVEVPSSGQDVFPLDTANPIDGFLKLDVNNCRKLGNSDLNDEANTGDMPAHVDDFQPGLRSSCQTQSTDSISSGSGEGIYNLIMASNKDSANRASEVLNKLLPANRYHSTVSYLQCDPMIVKKKIIMRRRFLHFKEKVITLRFRAFRHFWKDDRLLASMKILAKSSKKLDQRFRFTRNSSQKYLPSDIPQFLYPVGIFNVVPEAEVSDYVSRLLSDAQVKLCRNTLKMPALILDDKEKMISKFISSNCLVEDPCAVEKERSMINLWSSEEREVFIDKLATFGKDFSKIASFLDHKTTADCVEFYYKNRKSDCFEKARNRPDVAKPKKSRSTNTYLVASGKRWNREVNAASLDIVGSTASVANAIDGIEIQQNRTSRYFFSGSYKALRIDDGSLEQWTGLDVYNNDRETVAADVLAGICGSLSSEATGSCITSSVDLGEGYHDWRYHRVGSSTRQSLAAEVTQNVDGERSDDSCEEMDSTDWTDEEKSIFIQAVSSYGKDFAKISRCVRTRSRDQCKVYFSKARKCLGLDLIHPSTGDVVSGDVNGGGSDAEGACVVGTGSVISSEKSRSKMEDDLLLSCESDLVGTMNLNPNVNKYENSHGIALQVSTGTERVLNNSVPTDCQVNNKPGLDFDVSCEEPNGVNSGSAAAVEHKNVFVSSEEVAEQVIEEADHNALPNRLSNEAVLLEVPNGHPGRGNEGRGLLLPECRLNEKKVENGHATSGETNSLSCSKRLMNYEPQPSAIPSHPSADIPSSSQVNILSGCQKKAGLESSSADKSHTIMWQHRDCLAPTSSLLRFTAPTKVISSAIGDDGNKDDQGQEIVLIGDCHRPSGHSLLDHIVSSHVLCGYPSSDSTIKERNSNMSCKRPILLRSAPNSDGNFHPDRHSEFYFQKCNSSRNHSSDAEASLPSREQTKDHYRPQSGSSTDMEKPCGNGDVKLFGKILTSSELKPISSVHKSEDDKTQHHKAGNQSFNMKLSADRSTDFNSDQVPFEHDNCLGSEHVPVRNFGFCDGNKMQNGFPHLPYSTLLLTKYPDAFSNCAIPSAKLERGVRCNGHNLNGISCFPNREPSSSNGVADYQVLRSREVEHFSIDMRREQELYAEMQRRNRFDVISGIQQQGRGMVGINLVGRGGVLVGGQTSGVSDPVAVIKMQYAKKQFGAQNIIIEDDSWRSKGDVGR
ncbi:Nuclear receptor coregulator SMRT SMRTER [Olea europaea subsp. europaea]|uniref:Nuclear receptor coregulator SMRT SMRTER n=1 Tax=Olea europaea subsp. europaea TaxID=158383 RepID=A0A8S0QY63_OLEEU|nr:Nuclear receptor coregulator SMRT SMRTER [Olea europaea subsp. europaea]